MRTDPFLELSGGDVDSLGQAETPCLMNAAVLRGNHIQGGKILVSVGSQRPFRAEDLLIEDNRIDESPVGIEIGARTAGVMLRRNTLAAVVEPLAGEGIAGAWMEPGARSRHWLGSLEGVVRRLDAGAWPAIVADLPREHRPDPGTDPDSQRVALQRAAAAKVTRTLAPPHHPDLARVLWGARVEVRADPAMESLLDSGSGGEAALRVQVHPGGPDVPDCRVEVDWPRGWTALPVDGPTPGDRGAALQLPVRLPPGALGSFSFPARVTLRVGDATVSWQETVSVGSGSVGDWRVLGPMPADVLTRAATRLQPTRAGAWRLDEPVDLGPDGPWTWRSVPRTHRLDPSGLPGGIAATPDGIVGAFMLASFVAGQDLWAELTAATGAPGGGLEIQVHLDGRELWDLRLGRETWSPKRLPLKVSQGRHWLLVTGRARRTAPDISLSIRELGVPTGGRIHPVPVGPAPPP